VETVEALMKLEIERSEKLAKEIHAACDAAEKLLEKSKEEAEPPAKKQK
jgi:hypothetical protein